MSGPQRYALTTAWTQIAATGQTVDVQNASVGTVVLGTAATGSPTVDGIILVTPSIRFTETMTANLFARALNGTAVVVVMDGFSGPGGSALPTNAAQESGGNLDSINGKLPAPVSGRVPVNTPTPSSIIAGQVKIAGGGAAVQLPSNATLNGFVVKASPNNAQPTSTFTGAVGSSSAVTTAIDGSSTAGYPLSPGEAMGFSASNTNAAWVIGAVGDVFSFGGN